MNRGCFWGIIGLIAVPVFLVMIGLIVLLIFVFRSEIKTEAAEQGRDEYPQLTSVWSYGSGATEVVRIQVQGVIQHELTGSFFASVDPVESVLRQIRAATVDENIMGIILEIDSPGGDVTACDEIYHALIEFKAHVPHRMVVAIFGDMAASGGYYIACAADYIIARPTSITGSIGVLISSLNFRQLGQKIGVEDVTIKSGTNKDLMNPLREMSLEQRALLQEIVDTTHNRFVGLVAKARRMPEAEVRPLADGRIYTAMRAKDLKLVDQIGYWSDAQVKMAHLLNKKNIKVMRYEEEFSWTSLLHACQNIPLTLHGLLRPATTMKVQFLMTP
jgi:protease IV